MNKETTYRFIPITKEIVKSLSDKKRYYIKYGDGGDDFVWESELHYCLNWKDVPEILLPVEEKQDEYSLNMASSNNCYPDNNLSPIKFNTQIVGGVKVSDDILKSTINIGGERPKALSEVFVEEKQVSKEEVQYIRVFNECNCCSDKLKEYYRKF